MSLFEAIILGLVEGVTEFLPISSTAHLGLTASLLGIPHTDFVKTFEIAIQLGAILAVLFLFGKRLATNQNVWKRVLVAFLPTAVVGFVLYKLIKDFLIGNHVVTLLALGIGGVLLILFEKYMASPRKLNESSGTIEALSYKHAFLIGLAQTVAVIPGVSRAAATIVSSRLVGLSKVEAVEFSFLLAVPTILAAAGYDLLKTGSTFSQSEFLLLFVGGLVAFLSALVVIKWLIRFVEKNSFVGFGVYRVFLALVLLFVLF